MAKILISFNFVPKYAIFGMMKSISAIKLGILGGGQLGRMLVQAGKEWNLDCYVLDESIDFPAGNVGARFTEGNFKSYQDVYNFGKNMDILTVEIEHVNIEALYQLQSEGVKIHPKPEALAIIKDKGLQKEFYKENGFPTASFKLFENKEDVLFAFNNKEIKIPFVQKSRLAGYDGKGVLLIKSEADLVELMDIPCVIEEAVEIDIEIAVIAAKNETGQVLCFPAVDMYFHPIANLVEIVTYPSESKKSIQEQARQIAEALIKKLKVCGLLAVEFFISKNGELLINEVAPRPHNSGHLTMEGCITSQFQQHIRGICNLALGSTEYHNATVMMNLLGNEGYSGNTIYENMEACLAVESAYIHLYGKKTTKSFRKMGHVNVIDSTVEKALKKAIKIKETLKIIA